MNRVETDASQVTIPPTPIRVVGDVKVKLFGLQIVRIDLDLTIAAIRRAIDVLRVGEDDEAQLEQLSRRELYAMARTRDVAGRSQMSRDELLRSLTERDRS